MSTSTTGQPCRIVPLHEVHRLSKEQRDHVISLIEHAGATGHQEIRFWFQDGRLFGSPMRRGKSEIIGDMEDAA